MYMLHGLITLIICLVIGWFDASLVFLPASFYVGREIAQAEERYIKAHDKKRENCPWYCGFLKDAWTEKGMCDWCIPVIVSILCYLFFKFQVYQFIFDFIVNIVKEF